MTPEEIKKELRSRGITYERIGRRARPVVTKQTVAANVEQHPRKKSMRVRRLIAAAIGRSVDEVFGDAPTTVAA